MFFRIQLTFQFLFIFICHLEERKAFLEKEKKENNLQKVQKAEFWNFLNSSCDLTEEIIQQKIDRIKLLLLDWFTTQSKLFK